MKVLIVGGVAAGTKTAAKLKREDRNAEVVVITKDKDISYAGCGLPYYVGGLIESRDELIVNTPQKYAGLTGVEVKTGKEAVGLNADRKEITVRDTETGTEEICSYDKLVLAVGASPAVLRPLCFKITYKLFPGFVTDCLCLSCTSLINCVENIF